MAELQYGKSGAGEPVLVLHGTPGGWDQGIALGALLGVDRAVIAPSRPGYLQTPIDVGRTPEEQAAAFVGLIDALRLDRFSVIGVSGGMAALALAHQYPDRVTSLVSWQAVIARLELDLGNLIRGPLTWKLTERLMLAALNRAPRLFLPPESPRIRRCLRHCRNSGRRPSRSTSVAKAS